MANAATAAKVRRSSIPPPLYIETYRGISWLRTATGVLIFDQALPDEASRWGYWSRFFTAEQYLCALESSRINHCHAIKMMREGVDRALACAPCYMGHLHDQTEWARAEIRQMLSGVRPINLSILADEGAEWMAVRVLNGEFS